MRLTGVLLLTLMYMIGGITGNDDDDDDSWITTVTELNVAATLDCHQGAYPNDSIPAAWMFPNLTVVSLDYSDGRVTVTHEGYNMTIRDVTTEDFGLYHCMMRTPQDLTYLNRMGLNLKGPFFEDLWEKYQTNMIIGISACGGFLVLAFMTIGAWSYRWELSHPGGHSGEDSGPVSRATEAEKLGLEDFAVVNGGKVMGVVNHGYDEESTYM